jgi:adenylosuccinate synthase
VFHPGVISVIGNGVVVDPSALLYELETLRAAGIDVSGLRLSSRAHIVMPYHISEDVAREALLSGGAGELAESGGHAANRSIGTTRRGIGPAYAEKVQRAAAVRAGDLLRPAQLREKLELACAFHNHTLAGLAKGEAAPRHQVDDLTAHALAHGEKLRPHIVDTVELLHSLVDAGKPLLFEGANGTLLDVDHGTYPFVTSSNTCVLGIGPGSGVSERRLAKVLGVMKAYSTRVGAGPMPTELLDAAGERIRQRGREYGTTTGRPRRTGWLDLVAVRYAARLSACTHLAVMLLDVLAGFDELQACTSYLRPDGSKTTWFPADGPDLSACKPVYEALPGFPEDISAARRRSELPRAAARYLDFIEEFVGVPIELVSVGPDRAQTITT